MSQYAADEELMQFSTNILEVWIQKRILFMKPTLNYRDVRLKKICKHTPGNAFREAKHSEGHTRGQQGESGLLLA